MIGTVSARSDIGSLQESSCSETCRFQIRTTAKVSPLESKWRRIDRASGLQGGVRSVFALENTANHV